MEGYLCFYWYSHLEFNKLAQHLREDICHSKLSKIGEVKSGELDCLQRGEGNAKVAPEGSIHSASPDRYSVSCNCSSMP